MIFVKDKYLRSPPQHAGEPHGCQVFHRPCDKLTSVRGE